MTYEQNLIYLKNKLIPPFKLKTYYLKYSDLVDLLNNKVSVYSITKVFINIKYDGPKDNVKISEENFNDLKKANWSLDARNKSGKHDNFLDSFL